MSDASEPVLLVEDIGPVRRLTMNRPGALNALNHDLTSAISAAIREAGADDAVSVVILRGAGRAFCSGYDLNEDADEGELDARAWHASLASGVRDMLEIVDCPKPVIASVQSYCLAGGTDLMLACDLAVVADDAKFGYVDIRFGSGVVSMFLPVGGRGAQGQGAAVHRRGPRSRRRGAPDRPRQPGRAARRARRRDARARGGDREERVVRRPDDEARAEPRLGRGGVPRGDGGQHRARRDHRDDEPADARRVPPDHGRATG